MNDTDRWTLTLAALLGEPWPPLPPLPGVVYLCQDDPFTTDDKSALLLSDATDAEIGLVLGVTRQRANQLRQRLRQAAAQSNPFQPAAVAAHRP